MLITNCCGSGGSTGLHPDSQPGGVRLPVANQAESVLNQRGKLMILISNGSMVYRFTGNKRQGNESLS